MNSTCKPDYDRIRSILSWKSVVDVSMSTYMGFSFFYIVLGTALNVWLIVAIVTSPHLRAHLRNQLLCSTFILHLTESAVRLPTYFILLSQVMYGNLLWPPCELFLVLANATLIQDSIANWNLVLILMFFIASAVDFNPLRLISPLAQNIARAAVVILPWISAIIATPGIIHAFHQRMNISYNNTSVCMFPTRDAITVFKFLDTAVPVMITLVLLTIAALILRRKYFLDISSSSISSQLVGQEAVRESVRPYAVVVGVSCLCELVLVLMCLRWIPQYFTGMSYLQLIYASYTLSDSRVIVVPLAWISLPELRERLKTWGPWPRFLGKITDHSTPTPQGAGH